MPTRKHDDGTDLFFCEQCPAASHLTEPEAYDHLKSAHNELHDLMTRAEVVSFGTSQPVRSHKVRHANRGRREQRKRNLRGRG